MATAKYRSESKDLCISDALILLRHLVRLLENHQTTDTFDDIALSKAHRKTILDYFRGNGHARREIIFKQVFNDFFGEEKCFADKESVLDMENSILYNHLNELDTCTGSIRSKGQIRCRRVIGKSYLYTIIQFLFCGTLHHNCNS